MQQSSHLRQSFTFPLLFCMFVSVRLSICFSFCLSVFLTVTLTACRSFCISVCMSVILYFCLLSTRLFILSFRLISGPDVDSRKTIYLLPPPKRSSEPRQGRRRRRRYNAPPPSTDPPTHDLSKLQYATWGPGTGSSLLFIFDNDIYFMQTPTSTPLPITSTRVRVCMHVY